MIAAVFYFHQDLDFFLSPALRGNPVSMTFSDHQSVKHLVESLGVPHVELGLITANEKPVSFSYKPRDGDRIMIQSGPNCRDGNPRFVVDCHLGRLAAYLRMLGFDTLYESGFDDPELATIAASENRILLSRDRRLLMRKVVEFGYCLRSLEPREQLGEVVNRYDLASRSDPFQRCIRCNTRLQPVEKQKIVDRLQPLTRKYFNDFAMCPNCQKIYWQGSHYASMQEMIASLKS